MVQVEEKSHTTHSERRFKAIKQQDRHEGLEKILCIQQTLTAFIAGMRNFRGKQSANDNSKHGNLDSRGAFIGRQCATTITQGRRRRAKP